LQKADNNYIMGAYKQQHDKGNTMKTTTIDALIALFALAMIVVPMLLIGIQDFCRFKPFKPINKHKRFGKDSDYMKAVKGGSKALAEYHRQGLAEGLERRKW
jgi:lipopolysaccharide/colanic/teichoic acid biosynthesis glycosyltransferase